MTIKLTWYGHAAFALDVNGAQVLVDPFLTGNTFAPVSADAVAVDSTSLPRTPTRGPSGYAPKRPPYQSCLNLTRATSSSAQAATHQHVDTRPPEAPACLWARSSM